MNPEILHRRESQQDVEFEFWNTEAGFTERKGLLADQVQLRTYNHAVKV